jgi:hypothetical protein
MFARRLIGRRVFLVLAGVLRLGLDALLGLHDADVSLGAAGALVVSEALDTKPQLARARDAAVGLFERGRAPTRLWDGVVDEHGLGAAHLAKVHGWHTGRVLAVETRWSISGCTNSRVGPAQNRVEGTGRADAVDRPGRAVLDQALSISRSGAAQSGVVLGASRPI